MLLFFVYHTKSCDRIDEGGKKDNSKSCTPTQTGYIHQTAFSSQPNLTETRCNAVTCRIAACLKLLTGKLKLYKFRIVGLDSQMYIHTQEQTDRATMSKGGKKEDWMGN